MHRLIWHEFKLASNILREENTLNRGSVLIYLFLKETFKMK